MPIKFPKAFPRRKSSGNALDEKPNPPQPSFRVFERAHDGSKSLDGDSTLKRAIDERPISEGQYKTHESSRPVLNRGSGGTHNSTSTGGLYETSSSARFSSSSTLPSSSSFDTGHDDLFHGHPQPPQKAATASGFSLRAAGRTFSFGARKSGPPIMPPSSEIPLPQQHVDYRDVPDVHQKLRERALTETSYASGSTATPPKILDTDFGRGESDGFGDMFSGIEADKRASRQQLLKDHEAIGQRSTQSNLAPLHLDPPESMPTAQYSRFSPSSKDDFVSSPQQDDFLLDHSNSNEVSEIPSKAAVKARSSASAVNLPKNNILHQRESSITHSPSTFLDDDTRLAMQYIGADGSPSETTSSLHPTEQSVNLTTKPLHARRVTLYDGENQDHQGPELASNESVTTTPKAKQPTSFQEVECLINDVDFQAMAISADKFRTRSLSPPTLQKAPAPKSNQKVMTPAQFERYKREQESLRNQYASRSDSDDDDDDIDDKYEDDDEEERSKEMARQRRRQDAQMSVYRQQMMKVTGESQAPGLTLQRPAHNHTPSAIGLATSQDPSIDNKSSDDEDDIPLGILAAHGFPSKERPPSHMGHIGSQPNIRYTSETYPPPPMSVSGASVRESSQVPAFARNLPKDPFYGASIVNASDRQSLALGSGSQPVHGFPPAGGSGGLVGVIAKEERARAMRRGSPNATNLEIPNSQAQPWNPMGNSGPLHHEQQAQMQVSQQMTQMMQMQMQWMQQMMAMQGMQAHQLPGMPGLPNTGGTFPSSLTNGSPGQFETGVMLNGPRPTSVGGLSAAAGHQRPQSGSRSMSMLSPDPQTWNVRTSQSSYAPSQLGSTIRNSTVSQPFGTAHGGIGITQPAGGYTPSLAPSERSNIGLASRYRPVSTTNGADGSGRTSTMGSTALRTWEGQGKGKAAATMRLVPDKKSNLGDEDDDDLGWEEMRQTREKKRSLWRGKKSDKESGNSLEGVFYPNQWAELAPERQ